MDYYNEIKNKIIDNEIYARVKDYSKERNSVSTYYEIGKLLHEAGNKCGESIIKNYSDKLVIEVGKKYNKRTLFRMRQFYTIFSDGKVSTMSTQLSWSHYTELLSVKDENELLYYLNVAVNQNIDVRSLRNKIKNMEYERLSQETKNKLIMKEHIGQIQTYMNYIDKNVRTFEENETVGIVIVKKNNMYVMEYCSDNRIITKEYIFV